MVVITFLVLIAVVGAFAMVGNVVVTGGALVVGSGIFPVTVEGKNEKMPDRMQGNNLRCTSVPLRAGDG